MPIERGAERRGDHRRHADIARHITEQAVLASAVAWRTSEAGDKRTAAAIRLREAVDALLGLEDGSGMLDATLVGLALSGCLLLFWYGPASWLGLAGAWVGSAAAAWAWWRSWPRETFDEHLYSDCPRCERLPIACPRLERLARREGIR